MSARAPVLAPRVLAVASHVVSGHVGNKVAAFVLQSLGCDAAALNTVHFSNHTGYGQWTGTKASAQEIADIYSGLRQSFLDDFDMMISGYVPGADAVAVVGDIGKELKDKARRAPGSFFWVLDPVMGDNGKIYVAKDVVPAYKALVPHADLILPSQFEAELLSDVAIVDMDSLKAAIQALHDKYHVPHVVITSVSLPAADQPADHLSVVGSSMTSDGKARLFKIVFPSIDCYFSGTGDMFGALVTVRMHEAVETVSGLRERPSWLSEDATSPVELPLAKATEKVLDSMHEVLTRTKDAMPAIVERTRAAMAESDSASEKIAQRVTAKAAELQLVQNLNSLRAPKSVFKAKAV